MSAHVKFGFHSFVYPSALIVIAFVLYYCNGNSCYVARSDLKGRKKREQKKRIIAKAIVSSNIEERVEEHSRVEKTASEKEAMRKDEYKIYINPKHLSPIRNVGER